MGDYRGPPRRSRNGLPRGRHRSVCVRRPRRARRTAHRAQRFGHRRMTRLPLFALVLIGVIAAAGAAIALGMWRPLGNDYVEGVDVSAHQGRIDWDALSRSNVRFAYIKATEGTNYVDPRFAAN